MIFIAIFIKSIYCLLSTGIISGVISPLEKRLALLVEIKRSRISINRNFKKISEKYFEQAYFVIKTHQQLFLKYFEILILKIK